MCVCIGARLSLACLGGTWCVVLLCQSGINWMSTSLSGCNLFFRSAVLLFSVSSSYDRYVHSMIRRRIATWSEELFAILGHIMHSVSGCQTVIWAAIYHAMINNSHHCLIPCNVIMLLRSLLPVLQPFSRWTGWIASQSRNKAVWQLTYP